MSKPTESNYDLVEDLTANIAHAAWIEHHIDDWTGSLRSSTTDSGRVTVKGEHPDPAGNAATNDTDRNAQLVASAQLQIDDLARLRVINNRMNARRHGTLEIMELERAKQRVNERSTPSTVGFCEACPTYCDATTKYQSLIGKLCGSCRQAFDRYDKGGDPAAARIAFITQRRQRTAGQQSHAS